MVIYSLLYNGGYIFNTIIAVVVIFILQKAAASSSRRRTNPRAFPGRLFGGGRGDGCSFPARKHTAPADGVSLRPTAEAMQRFAHPHGCDGCAPQNQFAATIRDTRAAKIRQTHNTGFLLRAALANNRRHSNAAAFYSRRRQTERAGGEFAKSPFSGKRFTKRY